MTRTTRPTPERRATGVLERARHLAHAATGRTADAGAVDPARRVGATRRAAAAAVLAAAYVPVAWVAGTSALAAAYGLLTLATGHADTDAMNALAYPYVPVGVLAAWVAASVAAEAGPAGRFLDKHVVGTLVVDAATGRPGIGVPRAAARRALSLSGFVLAGLPWAWAIVDADNRMAHDILTRTRVVRPAPGDRWSRSPAEWLRATRRPERHRQDTT